MHALRSEFFSRRAAEQSNSSIHHRPRRRLYKKSKGAEARLSYLGHVMMENRNGLLVQTMLTQADGRAEQDAALLMASKNAGTGRLKRKGFQN